MFTPRVLAFRRHDAATERIRQVQIEEDEDGPEYGRPRLTLALAAHVGLRVLVAEVASVLLAVGLTELMDRSKRQPFIQAQLGVEFNLN